MTIRAMIVDDEPPAREGIRLRLQSEPDIEVVGEYGTAGEALAALEALEPDLLFLDVQMTGMTGIQMLRKLGPDRGPAVILVTAFEEYALDAFEVNVVDYILKPIDTRRFRIALDRARAHLERVRAVKLSGQIRRLIETGEPSVLASAADAGSATPARREYISRFLVSDGAGERPLNVSDVEWIEAAGDYVRLHVGSRYYLVRVSMAHLEEALDPGAFGRIHRAAIVRLDRVREVVPTHHGDAEVHLANGTVLKLSRSYRDAFRQALGDLAP
ncbi:MAG TPA: LytTR family DNA-binding domain-containing protein [Thermoanaerobaculales bacterium]|nr:LytTR family DNA-binding domain-containing protein [Thermoanaerobaculales bacterium]